MKSKKIVLQAALCGAVAGALAVKINIHSGVHIPAFALDRPLLTSPQFLAAALGWALFSLYWEKAAKNSAAAKSAESRTSRSLHVFLANAALLLEMAPIRGLGRFLPISSPIVYAGIACQAAGLFLAIWARRHLSRNWSGEIAIKVDHQLIRSGPYQSLRHPIYTGLLAMYTGAALVTGERLAILGLAMAAFAYWRKIRLEEVNLRVAFGAGYDAYCQESWALLPGLF